MDLDLEFSSMIGDSGIKVPGLGVIVYKDGQEIYSKFLGLRDVKRKLSVTRDTRFRVASVSKPFVIFALLRMEERNTISLDADVSEYLGFQLRNPNQPHKKITVRMLANHTSSIRDGKIYSIPPQFSIEEFFLSNGKFWERGAHFASADEEIGEYFCYSNLNYGLLGTIIERVTNERFDFYMQENIFKQLDIKAQYLPGNFSRREFEMLGTIYQKKNSQGIWDEPGDWYGKADDFKGIQPAQNTICLQNPYAEEFQDVYVLNRYSVGKNATIFSPQGGLRISFEELTHALEMMMNNGVYRGQRILSNESLKKMFEMNWIYDPQKLNGDTYNGTLLNYGLGSYYIDGKSSARVCGEHEINLIGHSGAAFGLFSGIFFIPDTLSGFVYMINGVAIQEDIDSRSLGQFSGNYIWEEKIMSNICKVFDL